MKRLVVVVLTIVVVAAGAFVWRSQAAAPQAAPTPAAATAAETQPSIRAKGTILPVRQTKLAFRAGGRVQTVAVKPGDAVKAGQLLAALDARDLELQLKAAQDDLTLAELALEQAARAATPEQLAAAEAAYEASEARYQELTKGSAPADVAAAESALAAARQQLTQAEASANAEEKIARATLESAQASLAQVKAGPRPEDVKAAEMQVEQARLSLWSAQTARDGLAGAVQRGAAADYELKAREAQLAASELAVRVAEQNLAKVKAGPSKEDLVAAQAAVDQAQAQLDSRLATRDRTLASARSSVAAAEARLKRVQAGSTDAELKGAQSSLAEAKAALAARRGDNSDLDLRVAKVKVSQAQTGLEQVKMALDGARLAAPYDGTVAAVLVAEHDAVAPGSAAIVFADLGVLQVETTDLDEGSVSKLAIGQPVKVTFDAFDEKVLIGRVARMAPLATTSEVGDVSYPVVVTLDAQDPEVRWGMTARLEFLSR